jgi:hypothetical protein
MPAETLTGRQAFEVAFYWGSQWNEYVAAGRPISAIRRDQASQFGRYYPATATQPAVRLMTPLAGRLDRSAPMPTSLAQFSQGGTLPAAALAIPKRAGLPTVQ